MRLELTWPNKDRFLLSPRDETGKPTWVERTHPAASEVRLVDFTGQCGHVVPERQRVSDNILFTGDSLDVLRVLAEHPDFRREYRGKIKCVYIDPPFNTGQTFEHYDDWMEHSTWLSFMRDRLLLIRDLLAADGSVWVHLDDAEQHRMRCLMDEIFGAGNFVATVVWEKARGAKGDTDISVSHDYILVYARERSTWKHTRNLLARTEDQLTRYANPDGDARGPWRQGADGTAKSGGEDALFPIELPSGRIVRPPKGNYWRFTQDRFDIARREGRVHFGKTGDSMPVIKTYLSEAKDGVVPQTWWPSAEVGSNQEAKRDHLRKLFPDIAPFATLKPERLIERVLHIASNPGDLVLDCFGGSGTTAAVAQKMGRRWVTTEILPETVATFTAPRLEAVVAGADPGGITSVLGWSGGGGFRRVQVATSMYEVCGGVVLLSEAATNGMFAKAMAAQLDFDFEPNGPFCGRRGRMRLAVFDGAVGHEEARAVVVALPENERVTVVAKLVLPGAEEMLGVLSKGSRIRKAPRDVLADGTRRTRRRETAR